MNDYNVTDYNIFSNATSSTNELINNIDNALTSLEDCKKTIGNESVFMGPIATNCLETLETINVKVKDMTETFKVVNNYLSGAKENYQTGDAAASAVNAEATSDYSSITGSGTMVVGNYKGNTYNVANTKGELQSYINYISKNEVAETKDLDLYSGNCLGFAYVHAYGIYSNRRNYTAEDGKHYRAGCSFNKYINDDKQAVLTKVYTELNANKPVVLQVNGNAKGDSRHFVTVVGYKSNVKNAGELKETDLLIIDSYDGRLKTMDQEGSRFMTSGAQCGKDYSGYRADCMAV